jgi:hypothetical protein
MGTKGKPNRDEGFCWFSCFQLYSWQRAVKAITPHIQDTDLTTVPGRIMEEVQSWSRLRIGRIMFVVPVTGRAACITFGGRDIGGIDTARESGYTAITLREDTKLLPERRRRHVSELPNRDQSTQQTEKSANERFQKIMAL